MVDLSSLTDQQHKAVTHGNSSYSGPVLVVSAPGSGKTSVITYRIAYLLSKGVAPDRILAVTFTNKAAKEMRERIDSLVGKKKAKKLWMRTFHSFGAKVIREHANAFRLPKNFTISDTSDTESQLKSAIAGILEGYSPMERAKLIDLGLESPRLSARKISNWKQNLLFPNEVIDLPNEQEEFFLKVYKRYHRLLRRSGSVDFDDLLMLVVKEFSKKGEVLLKYAEKFKHVLVDEYQDVNTAQFRMLKLLTRVHRNPFVVGDEDQAIYGFRGADVTNILNFEKAFPNPTVYRLENNFRSTPQIAEVANNIIKNNTSRRGKEIRAVRPSGDKVRCIKVKDPYQQAEIVIGEIEGLVKSKDNDYSWRDFAILYRTNAQSRPFEEGLVRRNIPHKVLKGMGFYNRAAIKDLLAYLRVVYNNNDEASLARIINTPKRGVGKQAFRKLVGLRDYLEDEIQRPLPLFELLESGKYKKELSTTASRGCDQLRSVIDESMSVLAETSSVAPLLETIIKRSGYLSTLRDKERDASRKMLKSAQQLRDRLQHVDELLGSVYHFDKTQGGSLEDYLEWVSLMQQQDDEVDGNKVLLCTGHASKGLEWGNVYVVGVAENLMPISNFDDEDPVTHIEEERRLFFVACTRAKDRLTLMSPQVRLYRGERIPLEISRFIGEAGGAVEIVDDYVEEHGFMDDWGKGLNRTKTSWY